MQGAPLLPKLRGHFAEFLNARSPVRLSIFYSSTCVGLRYGWHGSSCWQAFLGPGCHSLPALRHGIRVINPLPPPSTQGLSFPRTHLGTPHTSTGLLTSCPSPTLSSLGLGPTNPTRTDLPSEPLDLRRAGFSPAYALLMPAFSLLRAPTTFATPPSPHAERSPTTFSFPRSPRLRWSA